MIGKVHHVGYLVKNIDKSIKAFMALGYEVEKNKFFDNDRLANFTFLKKDSARVELVEPTSESDIYPLLKTYKNQIYHVCYEVDNIEKAVSEICGGDTGYLQFKEKQRATAISENAVVVFLMHTAMGIIELLEESDSFISQSDGFVKDALMIRDENPEKEEIIQ